MTCFDFLGKKKISAVPNHQNNILSIYLEKKKLNNLIAICETKQFSHTKQFLLRKQCATFLWRFSPFCQFFEITKVKRENEFFSSVFSLAFRKRIAAITDHGTNTVLFLIFIIKEKKKNSSKLLLSLKVS